MNNLVAIHAHRNTKAVSLKELDHLIGQQTGIGGKRKIDLFARFPGFHFGIGNQLADAGESCQRLTAEENQVYPVMTRGLFQQQINGKLCSRFLHHHCIAGSGKVFPVAIRATHVTAGGECEHQCTDRRVLDFSRCDFVILALAGDDAQRKKIDQRITHFARRKNAVEMFANFLLAHRAGLFQKIQYGIGSLVQLKH